MKTRLLPKIPGDCRSDAPMVAALLPEYADVIGLKVGDLAYNCFGQLKPVTDIFARAKDIRGKWFVCYHTEFGEQITSRCTMSGGMKEGELLRTLPLTGILNSAECDRLEAEMRKA